jgi:tetraacyldisaccharide 4'-kinase
MIILRIILLPFTLLYALIIFVRLTLYRTNIFNRTKFDFPIVCVGNIAVGGTGKTPHIEWLIEHLKNDYAIAVLSRGYKRKTSGYIFANELATPLSIGDEPYQLLKKFPQIAIGVSESRVLGVPSFG